MILLAVIALLLILIYLYLLPRGNSKYMKNLPGPKPNFLLGNTIDFAFKPTYKYEDIVTRYIATYGNVIKVHDGPFSVCLVVTEAKFVEYIMSSAKIITKADQYDYIKGWLGEGLLVSSGTKWKKRRRMLTPAFHFSILRSFVEVYESVGDIFIGKLEHELGKESVEISELVSLCTLDVICEAAMGIKLNAQTDKTSAYVRNTKIMCSIIVDRLISILDPALYPFTYNYFLEKKALKVIHSHTDSVIDKKIREKESDHKYEFDENTNMGIRKKSAFLDLLLKSTIDGKLLSRMDIREEVDTFMFEGHDTTASAISFAMYSLANNPDAQEKAVLEQKQIFEDWRNTKTTIAHLQQMKYLDLVIKETLRLYPSVPFLGRRLPEDMEWDGYLFQKGLNVMIPTIIIHKDPKYFPEPLKFKPERFENLNLPNPFIYMPFSAGPRNCIGQKFAMLEMKSLLSKVLRNFELVPATPTHELRLAPETILVSKNGVRISLKKRT